jgi:hypothetical protein
MDPTKTDIRKDAKKHISTLASPNPGKILHPGMKTEVRVRLMGDTETKRRWLVVSVRSNAKENVWNHKEVDVEEVAGKKVDRDVAFAAEALAAYQCEKHGDVHNPPAVAKAAREALDDLKQQAEQARNGRGRGH